MSNDLTEHSCLKEELRNERRGCLSLWQAAQTEFNTMLVTVKAFFDWANVELVETIFYANPDNILGSVRNSEEKMLHAFEVGSKIVKGSAAFC